MSEAEAEIERILQNPDYTSFRREYRKWAQKYVKSQAISDERLAFYNSQVDERKRLEAASEEAFEPSGGLPRWVNWLVLGGSMGLLARGIAVSGRGSAKRKPGA